MDMGNVIHQALEQFSKNLKKHRLSWKNLSKEQREALIDESVEEMIHDYGNTILDSSARNRYMIVRVKRILRRTVWALQEQLKTGKYEGRDGLRFPFPWKSSWRLLILICQEDEKLPFAGAD